LDINHWQGFREQQHQIINTMLLRVYYPGQA